MRARLRLVLPTIQVAVAGLLLIYANYEKAAARGNIYYRPPAREICYALNAPAALLRFAGMYLWAKLGMPYGNSVDAIDNTIFLFAVGMVWYLLAAVSDSGFGRRQSIVTARSRWRIGIDLLLMLPGVLFVFFSYAAWDPLHWESMILKLTRSALFAVWGLAMLIVCGRDFILSVSGHKTSAK
jgi:hypothetical protein